MWATGGEGARPPHSETHRAGESGPLWGVWELGMGVAMGCMLWPRVGTSGGEGDGAVFQGFGFGVKSWDG